jgi:hypothetical protein
MDLSFMRSRPTLAQQQSSRRAEAKPTKLDRAIANKVADNEDARKLKAWAREVKGLDGWKDRLTGRIVKPVLRLVPDRAEAHHVEPRQNYDVRYDVRNGLTLSFESHEKVERNEILIEGTKFFKVNRRRYIDCRQPVKFLRNGKVIHVG